MGACAAVMAQLVHAPRAALALCLMLAAGGALAQASPVEQQLKAAYLYKFAGFVEWPEGAVAPGATLVIGVAGDDALARQLVLLVAGRRAGGHLVEVRTVRPGAPLDGLHVLFVGTLPGDELAAVLAAARALPVLTVADADGAAAPGSMVNFVLRDERLRFAVALAQVAPSRLRISARMLAAASSVTGAAP
ncbi:MAG TPA: YfiR family protein [Telluria sp.]|nr:YfiR family protein [Telluria sp.]